MGASLKTPYEILGVSQNADINQIRNAFCLHIHALKQGELSNDTFRYICRAFECLSDDNKRRRYDESKKWIHKVSIVNYTLQQLATEQYLIETFKKRLKNITILEINAQDPHTGHTALYCAARVGNLSAVIELIKKGAELDLSQKTQSTALHVSAFYGHTEIVSCLLENGADYRIKNRFNATAEDEAYNDDIKRKFIELKQNPFVQTIAHEFDWLKTNLDNLSQHIDKQYSILRRTLLHCACKKGYLDLVQWLVEERLCNLDIVDINLNSALHLAAYNGHLTIINYLLNRGANSLLTNKYNLTAEQEGKHHGIGIHQIFENIRKKNMFDMAKDGIDWWFHYYFGQNSPNAINSDGTSLLYVACRYGQTSIAQWLLDRGANVNIQLQKGSGSTPLHGAVYHGHVSTVELLLAYGADVNIRNNYGATVFDEEKTEEIKIILEQYRRNLKNDKLMPVHIYLEYEREEPIAKIFLHYNATQNDLLEALPHTLQSLDDGYFSIAKRPLWFKTNDTTLLTAVCDTRYVQSKFIKIPLRLTFSTGKPVINKYEKSKTDRNFDYSEFEAIFQRQCQNFTITIQSSINKKQIHHIEDLTFLITTGSNDKNVEMNIQYIKYSNFQWQHGLPGCLCLFRITYDGRIRLKKPPIVSFLNESNVHLYTLASSSPYWFTSDTRQKRLPILEGIHAFFRHIVIIPSLLSLPGDMFLSMMMERPLTTRINPIPCKCLELRVHDIERFPLIAYHGTRIDAVPSILMDGLVVPDTLVANGTRVKPPPNHIPLYMNVDNIKNYAGAIFLSPSIYYSSDPIYATSFEYEGKRLLPILECSVKTGSYTTHRGTIPHYNAHSTDDINTIEWRIRDPINVEINAILFVINEFDQ